MYHDKEHTSRGLSTRTRILQAALGVFSEKGFERTTIREIADASQVTPPSLYYYFGSKERLFETLMHEHHDAFQSKLFKRNERGDPRRRIKSLVQSTYALMKENVDFVRIMRTLQYESGRNHATSDARAYYEEYLRALVHIIESGIRGGHFRPVNAIEIAWIIYGMLFTAADQICFNLYTSFDECRLDTMLDFVLDSMSAEAHAC